MLVMLDLGHGGKDPGAIGMTKEKDEVLTLGLAIEKELKKYPQLRVAMTRRDDVFISLSGRTALANSQKADLFVSLHFNSASNHNAKGFEIYHYPSSNASKKAAEDIRKEIVNDRLCLADRGVKTGSFYVLRKTKGKAILLEIAFISNKEDMANYKSKFNAYVNAITKGIVSHLGIPYKSPETHSKPELPKPEPVDKHTNLVLLGEPLEVPGEIVNGKTYVDIDRAYVSSSLISQDYKPIVEKNVKLGLVEILEACSLDVEWDSTDKVVRAGLSSDLKPETDYTVVSLLGNDVRIKTYRVKDKYFIRVGDFAIELRGFFTKIGLKVDWDRRNRLVVITK